MTTPSIQTSFVSGELSPSFFGRTEKPEYRNGASTMRNMFVNYRGGAMSRAGYAYVGMCKQGAPNAGAAGSINVPPRDINFQFSINQGYALEFGNLYMRVKSNGAYLTETPLAVSAITQNTPGVITIGYHGYSNGDWVFATGIGGMTAFNGLTWIVQNVTTSTFTLTDLFGNAVSTATFPAFTSGGTFARIFTAVSPYSDVDLPYLKFTQSANIMNLTCWNQQTNTEYPPYNLQRITPTNWTFTAVSFGTSAIQPTGVTVAATSSTTLSTWYGYAVTSVNSIGDESVASTTAYVQNNDIAINAGSNTVTWNAVTSTGGIVTYNVYGAQPVYNTGGTNVVPIGASLGFLGQSFGTQFVDTNITADFTVSPPIHSNPFGRGTINNIIPTAGGSSYSQATIGYSIGTTAGTGFVGTPIVVNGKFVGFYQQNGGTGYKTGDTLVITSSAGGTGATGTISVGPQTGTYPGTCQYFQQRLTYANTINQPDTYWMSQPGNSSNFDASLPAQNGDSLSGTPWGVQINGIQFMQPTITGLLTFTGNGVWMVNGGNSIAITPADQNAQAQAQIGCSALVPPLYINLHILYVQSKNSVVRDIAFNFLYNVFQGTDITVFSNHLFISNTIVQWAYAEEPYKLVWAVRDDGILLSLTYVKEQEVQGWARHDTNGLFVSVASVIEPPGNEDVSFGVEPPTDTIYIIAKRYIVGHAVWAYYAERQNNRLWQNVEDSFCVDSGLFYPLVFPNATLTPSALNGTNNLTSTEITFGGSGYTMPTAKAIDTTGAGTGATFSVTQSGGKINSVTVLTAGQNYAAGQTTILISDPTGSGAIVYPVITNNVTFTASSGVFTAANVGDVIRAGGGKATIVTYNSSTSVSANVTQPLTAYIPDDPNMLPAPSLSGTWSTSTPTSSVTGLNHLEGMTVSILADGGVQPSQTVTNGKVTFQNAASAITVGLGYTCQLQSMYLNAQEQVTMQGRRKDIQAVTVRVEGSRGFTVGTNQPDASVQPNSANVLWTNMKAPKEHSALTAAGSAIPLFTGDERVLVPGDWNVKGQIAIQSTVPLPVSCIAMIPEYTVGDQPG